MIENLYMIYREYDSLVFQLGWGMSILLIILIFFNFKDEKRQKKIAIVIIIIVFPIIGLNFWMDSYSYKFGMKYAVLLLENSTEIELEKNDNEKNFIKRKISMDDLFLLVNQKKIIKVTINTRDSIKYIITYGLRPEEYSIVRCVNKKKCLEIGKIKNKDFLVLIDGKIKEEGE